MIRAARFVRFENDVVVLDVNLGFGVSKQIQVRLYNVLFEDMVVCGDVIVKTLGGKDLYVWGISVDNRDVWDVELYYDGDSIYNIGLDLVDMGIAKYMD